MSLPAEKDVAKPAEKIVIKEAPLRAVFFGSLKLKPQESCLIVTDTVKESIGRTFYNYACRITDRTAIAVIAPGQEHSAEPPLDVARKMLAYDVQVLITDKSLTHTRARIEANARGARIATMPAINEEIINRCLDIDYEALRRDSVHLYNILQKSHQVKVTTRLGTDITFKVGESEFFGQNGGCLDSSGAYGNLPEGEISFAPSESEGIYVADASFPELGLLDSPLTFKVTAGRVYAISGRRSQEIIRRLNRAGERSWQIAEFGIGLNPKAVISGIVLEDEKVKGTVHIALGNNLSYGGDNDVPLHLDAVITTPDIYIDSEKFMEKGKFLQS